MVILGVILLIIGLVTTLKILFWIGVVLLVLGVLANFFYGYRRPVGSRRYYY